MSELIQRVEAELSTPKGIESADVQRAIEHMLGRNVDYGEVFIQSARSESFGIEDGIVKDGAFSVDAGIGVRALAGEKTGFAYCEDIRADGLHKAAVAAKSVAGAGSRGPARVFVWSMQTRCTTPKIPSVVCPKNRKLLCCDK